MKQSETQHSRVRDIKSGEGITLLFSEKGWELEYIEECCDCGAQHKVVVSIDIVNRVMHITWYILRKGNIKERWSAARQRRLNKQCGNRIISAHIYRT